MGILNSYGAILALILTGSLVLAGGAAAFSAATVYREAAPSVVVIFGFDAEGRGSTGSGTLISADGKVLTNSHVVLDPRTKQTYQYVHVYFRPAQLTGVERKDLVHPYTARLLARDSALDLALLQLVDVPRDVAPISIGDSEAIVIGEPVAAIGHPGGGGLWTLTTGTISSSRRDGARDVFQTDAAINPGNSGGPLLDEHARLIGVNTFVRRVNKQGLPLEGLNYSLRSSAVLDWLGRQGVALTISGAPPEATAAGVPAPSASEDDANEMRSAPDAPHATAGLVAIEPVPDAPEPARLRPHDEDERDLCEFEGERGERLYGRPNRAFRMERALSDVYRATRHNAGEAFVELDGEAMEEF